MNLPFIRRPPLTAEQQAAIATERKWAAIAEFYGDTTAGSAGQRKPTGWNGVGNERTR